jgi:hypothetical protein
MSAGRPGLWRLGEQGLKRNAAAALILFQVAVELPALRLSGLHTRNLAKPFLMRRALGTPRKEGVFPRADAFFPSAATVRNRALRGALRT